MSRANPSRLARLRALLAVPINDPDLARSQFAAFSRQAPLLYAILIINSIALAWTHASCAPGLLTYFMPAVLCAATLDRARVWFGARGRIISGEEALRLMRFTMLRVTLIATGFTCWSLLLLPYGDAYARCHVAFFMSVTVVSSIFCLMHLRGAALLLTFIVVPAAAICFIASGNPVLIAMALNISLVSIGVIFALNRNYQDFIALILSRRELITRQRETQHLSDENLRLANQDSLSGLPNRRRFFAELEATLGEAELPARRFAVVLLDLDRFKGVNDVYGHGAGDRLLAQVGLRLKQLARQDIFIARLGGDEFGVILGRLKDDADIREFAEAAATALRGTCMVGDRPANISCSMGAASFPEAGHTAAELFEGADYALYHAKQTRKGSLVIFSAEHETVIRRAATIEQAFRAADLAAELWLAFQPIFDIRLGKIVAFETLARWTSPELGLIGPDVFIPLAERNQMIGRLTLILLGKALAVAASWPREIHVSFNLSAHDLADARTMAEVRRIVLSSRVEPVRIEFEVTETALLQDFSEAAKAIALLHALGTRVSLDDFGTGYSSLGYVHRLTLDKIKIDRSFVTDVDRSTAAPNIIKTILDLCRNLGLQCVVEGVETKSQLQVLTALGCRLVQGYLLSRPVPASEIGRLLAAQPAQPDPVAR